ncbi:hypothetical protein GLYMA_10G276000v4 [Glycine max]|uniref:Uncharacterized protein n=1 Tax=Glycine max TaxID=3847 RepID=I1LEY3_SOYBN|nr:uncharacterized protein LOC100775242 [Glycine max]KAG4998617.1 hypothetical protein JHK85_030056 [Glycine max]KAG5005386.1 hypothetical protein JHK86_029525 [Glycine max]KAG5153181.1 hypothetical protein JHK84_029653 [Glycine max]KAH1140403.1 hypothetical protein GYH30_029337 [Glycine max]KAH1231162.1 hypothetical protein GmHk_10G030458 [Glycine max]|eukprot:XP_003536693.1 uncharacterized protein LOC100775242 [Glycine max]
MEMNSVPGVMSEAEYEEDTFYAEIRRQILLLTSEDNEDLLETRSFNPINVTNGGSNRSAYSFNCASPSASNFSLWERHSSGSPPLWLVNLWKNGKGTGVFIPQVACRKNQRPGRMNNSRRKIYRPVVNKD